MRFGGVEIDVKNIDDILYRTYGGNFRSHILIIRMKNGLVLKQFFIEREARDEAFNVIYKEISRIETSKEAA